MENEITRQFFSENRCAAIGIIRIALLPGEISRPIHNPYGQCQQLVECVHRRSQLIAIIAALPARRNRHLNSVGRDIAFSLNPQIQNGRSFRLLNKDLNAADGWTARQKILGQPLPRGKFPQGEVIPIQIFINRLAAGIC